MKIMKIQFSLLSIAASFFLFFRRAAAAEALPVTTAYRFDNIELRASQLRDALSLIGESAGMNLAASDEAAQSQSNHPPEKYFSPGRRAGHLPNPRPLF